VFQQKISTAGGERRTALERVGQVQSRATIQPTSITAASRKLIAKTVKEENRKVQKIASVQVTDKLMQVRPEDRMKALEKEEDAKIKMLSKQRSDREDRGYQPNRIRMSADYLQADDAEYDTVNLSDLKDSSRQRRPRRDADMDSEEDSDDDDDEDDDLDGFIVKGKGDDDDDDDDDGPRYFRKDGKKPAKKSKPEKRSRGDEEEEEEDEEEEEEEEEDEDEDEDSEDEAPKKKSKKKPTKTVDDADADEDADEDADTGRDSAPSTKRRRAVIDDDDE